MARGQETDDKLAEELHELQSRLVGEGKRQKIGQRRDAAQRGILGGKDRCSHRSMAKAAEICESGTCSLDG